MRRASIVLREIAVLPIRAYRAVVSPLLPRSCRYYPSCSHYAMQAVREYGLARGAVLVGWRLVRCNPWSHGGYDPVESQMLFTRGARSEELRSEEFGAA